ncbi:hypothetical protein QUF70_21595, partial [Desulfobacterales bacterium HSG17]|nr:hypothetical protein [Desulfobacterales bacterium HSG17]
FTIIELLIAMAITTIVSAGIFSAYQNQQKTHRAQQQIVEMQQNIRAALYFITNEIRMAGYNPNNISGVGITNAGNGSNGNPLTFTSVADNDCIDNDGDSTAPDDCTDSNVDEPGELKTIAYDLYDSSNDIDTALDDLGRRNGARLDTIAGNIQGLSFVYFDATRTQIPFTSVAIPAVPASRLTDIRSIRITITAIPEQPSQVITNGRTLTKIVQCRNLGL